ncbi:Uncharacterized protein FWK35_00026308 [Aphis craccivora]|uniref:Uncharacterized protein n=1 Tax=Aphis craccivora TaxID=307492 RepID=A0A6G0VW11_APHCR|nr:Uncharacterized protein FWK35_00026308 [Aphis craccivora]
MRKHIAKIHKVFRELSDKKQNNTIKKTCNYCNWTTVKNATRQLNHILKCNKSPKNIKDAFQSDSVNVKTFKTVVICNVTTHHIEFTFS